MAKIPDYEKQVYAGLLGKVIGVYLGRPFEQWHKDRIEAKWGEIQGYVHEDMGVPLVVADDDISGTLTFIRILEDGGLYETTPDHLYGENWLNYIMENRTILWWGGKGMSTEHTAYLNLKNGIQAPDSGSIAQNGQPVAEQIGAQIFIDGFGLVTPGNTDLAVNLAKKAGSVSHDGESVHAACVVAAMVSLAFIEKDMDLILDKGISFIPADSMISQVHRDVRRWVIEDSDWRLTYNRIETKYGYACFGGTCHVIPNHALMVMAWCYAPDNFYEAQKIINTAGYDTDCNAANVGTVMGLVVGLERINEHYEFQAPFADRLILPTAEGTYSVSDVLTQAQQLARIGRRIMGIKGQDDSYKGVVHHFSMPGAMHGYQLEKNDSHSSEKIRVRNKETRMPDTSRGMSITYGDLYKAGVTRISTPLLPSGSGAVYGQAKQMQAVPRLYPGMEVIAQGYAEDHNTGQATVKLFLRSYLEDKPLLTGSPVPIQPGLPFTVRMQVPQEAWPIKDLGFQIEGDLDAEGDLFILTVKYGGHPHCTFPDIPYLGPGDEPLGWIFDVDRLVVRPFPADQNSMMRLGKDQGIGVMVTGTRAWTDYIWETTINIHLAKRVGLIVRYQGLRRFIGILKTTDTIQLVRRYYGESVIRELPMIWKPDEDHHIRVSCSGEQITVWCDGDKLFEEEESQLLCGGAGYFIEEGLSGFRNTSVESR